MVQNAALGTVSISYPERVNRRARMDCPQQTNGMQEGSARPDAANTDEGIPWAVYRDENRNRKNKPGPKTVAECFE